VPPDIASIRVSDAKNGWVSFPITTPNSTTLPGESIVSVSIDADNRRSTGDSGAEVRITSLGGEFQLERWVPANEELGARRCTHPLRIHNAGGVVALDVHRSELGGGNRLGFTVVTADLNTSADAVVGIDVVPDEAPFFTYAFTNKAALTLEATRVHVACPASCGKAVRSESRRPTLRHGKRITSGTVACRVLVNEKTVPAKGSVAGGSGRCAFVVPASAEGKIVRGSIIVRASGKSVAADFAYLVR
jgi:hypothetical protein